MNGKNKLELRAIPILQEKRNTLIDEMEKIVNEAKGETRSLSADETGRYDTIKSEIKRIDATLLAEEEIRSLGAKTLAKNDSETEKRVLEEKKFLKFICGETRALNVDKNDSIIPAHISNRIIEKIKELSPIYSMCTVFNAGGDLVFPYYGADSSNDVKAAYTDDLTELIEQTGKFTTVKLENYIVGCLALVSKSLMNRTDFDLLSYIVMKVAQAIAEFLEEELIKGDSGKMQGLESSANIVTSGSATSVSSDELIDLQMAVPEVFQENACWIMHKNTLKAIRKLKNSDGDYLLTKDLTQGFGWLLLGKRVYFTQSCNEPEAGKKAIFYGDMSGLYLKLAQNIELQILYEKYATQHALGVVGYVECDSKIVEAQKIVALQMKAA